MQKLIILSFLTLSGCGIAEDITNSDICKGKTDLFCDTMFGNDLQSEIDALEDAQDLSDAQIDAMQDSINQMQQQMIELTERDVVVEYIDPCGDYPRHYDEILMRTATGKLIAYFESGGRRFLTLIGPGRYVTTDAQRCRFTVTADGQVL